MQKEYCLVIMPSKKGLKEVYDDAIKPVVKDLGLECKLADRNNVKRIIEDINSAKFIIADITERDPNVFYELGVAHSLGKKTIILAQSIKKDIPLDVINYKKFTMDWKGIKKLKEELEKKLKQLVEQDKKQNNPVWDSLPSESLPITAQEYNKIKQALKRSEQDLQDLKCFFEAILEVIFKDIPVELTNKGISAEEMLKIFWQKMDESNENEVTPPSSTGNKWPGRRKRIKFTKIL